MIRVTRIEGARTSARRLSVAGALVVLLLAMLGLSACRDAETAVTRGDRLWADSQYTAALAEYRLALRQGGAGERELLRAAHAFVRTGAFDQARETYDELLARAPEYGDQALYDYLTLARDALERGDRYDMARAVDAALELRPELSLPELNEPIAAYYREVGETDRALTFYRRALGSAPADSAGPLLYQIGLLYEARDDCRHAVEYYRAYLARAPADESEAAWHLGNCAFRLARAAHQQGFLTEAMRHLGTVLELGIPENVQDEAWFRRGDIEYALGRFDDALAAFRMVLELNPARSGRLVERAQERIDQIRFREFDGNEF